MSNSIATAFKTISTMKKTENGANAYSTTDNACVDLFSTIGALRNGGDYQTRLYDMIHNAYVEDPLLLAKILFYARDIRGGLGERQVFRDAVHYCADKYPSIIKANINLIPEYGRWDDMFCLIDTCLEKDMWEIIGEQFANDELALKEGSNKVSLLAKWMPSADTSSADTRALAFKCADALGMTVYEYKRRVRALRKLLNLLETKMTSKKWSEIEYATIPSQAHSRHTKAFYRNDTERYTEYIKDVTSGKKKINTSTLYPYEIVEKLSVSRYDSFNEQKECNKPFELMWKNLPDYITDKDTNILVMADTSGSMAGRPMSTSTSLAIYFAERNEGPFKDLYMTFESEPRLMRIKRDVPLADKYLAVLNGPWGGSTNLEGAFNLLLDVAVQTQAKPEEMPKSLIIITDMEINYASGHRQWETIVDLMRRRFNDAGYELPNLIFWNVASRQNTFLGKAGCKGLQMVSGSSPSVFKTVIGFFNGMTALDVVRQTLDIERYSPIKLAE